MGEFFRGRKRKFGLLSLLMALVFMAAWMRSLSVNDQFILPPGQHRTVIGGSFFQYFILFMLNDEQPEKNGNTLHRSLWVSEPYKTVDREVFDNLDGITSNWSWYGVGIRVSSGEQDSAFSNDYAIPYALITIPLTVISLWPLLSKSRVEFEENWWTRRCRRKWGNKRGLFSRGKEGRRSNFEV